MTTCSEACRARGDLRAATASIATTFVMIEDDGPWGPSVLKSPRVPEVIVRQLASWQRDHGVRPLLIRRPGRRRLSADSPRTVFVANARHGWIETAQLTASEIGALDLSAIKSERGVGLQRLDDPVVLVCTHGRHDQCCAMRGRPVALAAAQRWPDAVWESSHLGGDRFAANLVVLPRGDFFGGLDAEGADTVGEGGDVEDDVARTQAGSETGVVRVLSAYLAGQLDPLHHRGRSCYQWPVQAALQAVREQCDAWGVDDVEPVSVCRIPRTSAPATGSRDGFLVGHDSEGDGPDDTLVVVDHPSGRSQVRVRTEAGEAVHLTCNAEAAEAPPLYEVTFLT